jgi:hypothetical protein
LGLSHPIKRSPDRLRSQTSPGITEHRPNIFRAFPGISGHRRTRNDHRVPYRPSPVTPSRMARRGGIARRRIACHQARRCGRAGRRARRREWSSRAVSPVAGHGVGNGRRVPYRPSPDRVRSCSSRAVSPVAGHGVGNGRRVPYRPSPDRVPSGPSLDHVSSCPGPCRRPHVSAAFTVGRAERPSSAMSRPNSACSRRRPGGLRTCILFHGRGVQ